jgi:DNA-binding NarL/FixJ family response regulator
VRVVATGEELLDPAITQRLVADLVQRPARPTGTPPELAALSERELEVMRHVARGRSNAEIAAQLVLAETTVKTHGASALHKLGARDRVQLVIRAYESGLVAPNA